MNKEIILIVGLGNPGSQYEKSRHNVGFMALDLLADELKAHPFKSEKKFRADVATADFHGNKVILAKPTTFMNLSGESIMEISQFYKIDSRNIYIIYDDIDLPLGQVRIRKEGGPGTHNGMKSIVQYIGNQFPRIRVGIESRGETAPQQQDLSSFVLAPFLKKEESTLKSSLRKTVEAVKTVLDEGLDSAMNSFNG